MDFTIVNLGTKIGENVEKYLRGLNKQLPQNNITWAVKSGNSTKIEVSGGLGLSLMQEFIYYNEGKYQIVSGNEFWELNNRSVREEKFSESFPETIINIEIDQNDTSFYKYKEKIDDTDIF